MAVLWLWRNLSAKCVARLKRIVITYTPEHKTKIVFVFYQIATRIPRVYEVALPASVANALDTFSTVVTFGMENVAVTPLECMGLAGYVPRLLFWMTFPAAVTLVIVGYVVLSSGSRVLIGQLARASILMSWSWREPPGERDDSMEREDYNGEALLFHLQRHEEKQRPQNIFEETLRYVLFVIFFLYPTVTNVAFEGFPCCARCLDPTHDSAQLALICRSLLPTRVTQSGLRPSATRPGVAGCAPTCPSSATRQRTSRSSSLHGSSSSSTRLACGFAASRYFDTPRRPSCLARVHPSLARSPSFPRATRCRRSGGS
jgi:hypothetical protein